MPQAVQLYRYSCTHLWAFATSDLKSSTQHTDVYTIEYNRSRILYNISSFASAFCLFPTLASFSGLIPGPSSLHKS